MRNVVPFGEVTAASDTTVDGSGISPTFRVGFWRPVERGLRGGLLMFARFVLAYGSNVILVIGCTSQMTGIFGFKSGGPGAFPLACEASQKTDPSISTGICGW